MKQNKKGTAATHKLVSCLKLQVKRNFARFFLFYFNIVERMS